MQLLGFDEAEAKFALEDMPNAQRAHGEARRCLDLLGYLQGIGQRPAALLPCFGFCKDGIVLHLGQLGQLFGQLQLLWLLLGLSNQVLHQLRLDPMMASNILLWQLVLQVCLCNLFLLRQWYFLAPPRFVFPAWHCLCQSHLSQLPFCEAVEVL